MKTTLRERLSSLMTVRLSRQALILLSAFWVLFLVLPLFALSFYAYPTHDDFPNARLVITAWAQSGSLLDVVKASWQQAMLDYNNWQGTFAAMFICALQPMVISVRLFWLTPAVTLFLLCLSAAYLVKQIARFVLRADSSVAAVLYAVLMTVLIFFAPGISELLYWHASIQYTFSIIVMLALTGLLIKLHQPQHIATRVLRTVLAALLAFILGGLPYTHALGGVVALALTALWCIRRRSPALWPSLFSFAAGLAALILVVIAPGNAIRQAGVGDSLHPIAAIVYSLEASLCCTADWFGPEWLAAALLLLPLLWPLCKACPVRFRNPGWFSLFTFGILAACYVPPIFATGVEGWQLPRIEGSLYMLWALLAFLNLLYWIGWASQHLDIRLPEGIRTWQPIVCAVLLVWGVFASGAIFATPTAGAYKSLLTGEAAQYRTEILVREQAIHEAETLEEARNAIEPLSVQPPLFPLDMLIYQTETQLPAEMHIFFEAQELIERFGAGKIPAEEWEAIKTWEGIKFLP